MQRKCFGKKCSILMAVILITVASIPAAHAYRLSTDDPEWVKCVDVASTRFGVPELAIWTLIDVEGGKVGSKVRNTDGSHDLGPMQINTWWLKHVAKFDLNEADLRYNLCANIFAGTWILANELKRHHSIARAIAYYHSPTSKHRNRYLGLAAAAVERRMRRFNQERSEMIAAN